MLVPHVTGSPWEALRIVELLLLLPLILPWFFAHAVFSDVVARLSLTR